MTLEKLSITGYKSIEHAEVDLRALNVLIGANGAGKSNFVGVFELLRELAEGRLQVYVARRGGADALLRFGRAHTPALVIDFDFEPNGYRVELAPSDDGGFFFAEETCRFRGQGYPQPFEKPLGAGGHSESMLARTAEREPIAAYVLRTISSWRVYHFHDTSSSARVKQIGDIGDNEALRPDASNLAAYLYRLENTARPSFDLIVKIVQRVAPFFDGFKLHPDRNNEDKIRLEWAERGSDAYFNAHALSDGTLRFICLATLLLQPDLPSMILLDEPELGLHPLAITLLAELLQRAAHYTQVIVSTQSVSLVDELEAADLIVVDREPSSGASTFRRPTPEDARGWLDDYSLGELWRKNVLGGRPR